MSSSSSSIPARMVRCPVCGKQTKFTPGNPYRPFCSERCKLIDLGQWAEGKYAIPAVDASAETDAGEGAEAGDDEQ